MKASIHSHSLDTFRSYYSKIRNACLKPLTKKQESYLKGAATGDAVATFGLTTGPLVALHEVIGHGCLGYNTIYTYGSEGRPYFWVLGWDNFKAITHAASAKDFFSSLFRWVFGMGADPVAGSAYRGNPSGWTPTGQAIGPDGSQAWISIAGSLPALALDSLSVIGGMCLRKRSPLLGSALVAMGLTDNLQGSFYAISAATMNDAQLNKAAFTGHDFANFAVRMSHILHIPAEAVAISTAAVWTGFVPLLALGTYLHTKSHATEVVPDTIALHHWIKKSYTDPKIKKELERHLNSFPEKEKLQRLFHKMTSPNYKPNVTDIQQIQRINSHFLEHLLDKISTKSLENIKSTILESWSKDTKPDKLQTIFTTAAITGSATAIATKCLQTLAPIFPVLSTTATALTYASPLFTLVTTLSTAYQVYKDLKCPDSVIPHSAKMLSIARLATSIACAAFITVSLFVPGLNALFIGAIFIGTFANVILAFIRAQIVQRQFAKFQAMQPENRSIMHTLWNNHNMNPNKKLNPTLEKWINLAQRGKTLRLLENVKTQTPLVIKRSL